MKNLIGIITVLLFTQIVNAQHNTVMFGSPYQNHNCNPYCVEAHQGYGTYWSPSPNQNFWVGVSVRGNNGSFNFQFQGKRKKQRCLEEYVEIPQHYHSYKTLRYEKRWNGYCWKKVQIVAYKDILCTNQYCTNW